MKPQEDDLSEYPIRTYGKTELALLYNPYTTPHAAVQTLMRWIRENDELWQLFTEMKFNPHRHTFFSREVELIYRYIGKP
jgi:hypothetical protein